MPLQPGARLGPYEVLSALGAGGMGEVYRALDTKLGREVAIKLVLQDVASDPERLARFEREARILASLNHPNIATLHGFFTAAPTRGVHTGTAAVAAGASEPEVERTPEGEVSFLVMELVEGETLADRIARGPIPAGEAIALFLQIAHGLEAAHEKGVIHRDLKPANVKITSRGAVKILDFGLAKAMLPEESAAADAALSASPTLTLAATQRGQILGTAAYMSPEQARGKPVDERADVWAFGVCLYEALSGRSPFRGEDAPATLAKVLESSVDLDALAREAPPALRQIVERCLRKDPSRRTHHIADVRIALEELPAAEPAPTEPAGALGRRSTLGTVAPWLLALAMTAAAGALLWRSIARNEPRDSSPEHYEVELPRAGSPYLTFALSPDGRYLSYTGVGESGDWVLYLRPLRELEAHEVAGTAKGENSFFSPDSRWLAFHAQGQLRKVPVEGGRPTVVCETAEVIGGAWLPGGDILFGGLDGMYRVPASGGTAVRITDAAAEGATAHAWPTLLPRGDSVLYTVWKERGTEATVAVLSLSSGTSKALFEGSSAMFAPTGHLLFKRGASLMAVRFDPESWTVSGEPTEVVPDVVDTDNQGSSYYQVAESGHLVYLDTENGVGPSTLVTVDRSGAATAFHRDQEPGEGWMLPQVSPSGARVAYTHHRRVAGVRRSDLESYDLTTGRTVPIGYGVWPVWSPDEAWIAFVSNQAKGINTFRARSNGSGEMEQLTFDPILRTIPTSWSVDDVLAIEQGPNHKRDILTLSMGTTAPGQKRELRPFLASQHNERGGKFSPDGRWLAFTSDRSGQDEVWIVGYPDAGAPKKVSLDGGREPVWSRDGRELFYRYGDEMRAVPVHADGDELRLGNPELLFRGTYSYGYLDWNLNYDVFPDGRKFLLVKDGPPPKVHVLVNWFGELERLVPTR